MKICVFFCLLLALSSAAIADELDDGYNACIPHRTSSLRPGMPQWQNGWEHCATIIQAWHQRDAAKRAQDEKTNPTLKMTRDLAKKLGGGP